jgi:hypothetical protein
MIHRMGPPGMFQNPDHPGNPVPRKWPYISPTSLTRSATTLSRSRERGTSVEEWLSRILCISRFDSAPPRLCGEKISNIQWLCRQDAGAPGESR